MSFSAKYPSLKLIDYAESSLSLQTEASLQPYFGIRSKDFKIATNIGKYPQKLSARPKTFWELGSQVPPLFAPLTARQAGSQTRRQAGGWQAER